MDQLELGLALPSTNSIKDFDLNVADEKTSRCERRCVKVKMEGVGIARKVDLSLHDSYKSLINALYNMFPCQQYGSYADDSRGASTEQRNYVIKYEHDCGAWMLVGCAPWETFVRSVKRIEILSNREGH